MRCPADGAQRIGTLGGLDFDKGPGDLIAFGCAKALDSGLLAFKTEKAREIQRAIAPRANG